ncbi:hypothetical protein IQ06DRAFT_210842 [Phaeosphaeriaceae sp. SRC1lsM3a]|nr:hypothetical protein IQ06DRAFT_210842 [Stagonospora sp. SRC1lsM3a]
MSDNWRIAQPYCVALAPSAKSFKSTEPLWYAGCKTLSGEDKLYYTQNSFEATYVDLTRWLKGLTDAPRSCFLTFGQNQSYFACAPGQGSIWGGIPSELEDKVRKSYDAPLCVGLGKHNAWVVLYPDGYLAWKFYGHYSALDKILKEAAPGSVAYVAISPYHKEHYFVANRDRSIKYNFKGAPKEWMALMTEVFKAWAAEPMQKQPLSYVPQNPPAQQRYYPQEQHAMSQAWQQAPQQPYQQAPHQPYPQVPQQPYQQPLHQPYQQAQAPNNYNSPHIMPAQLDGTPVGSTFTSPAPSYSSPVPQHALLQGNYGYAPPQGGAMEILAELPGDTMVAASLPSQALPMDVSSSSFALLARDLWGADAKIEEETFAI